MSSSFNIQNYISYYYTLELHIHFMHQSYMTEIEFSKGTDRTVHFSKSHGVNHCITNISGNNEI